jgi:asparagine synthase (glutamine-hydrolysing)
LKLLASRLGSRRSRSGGDAGWHHYSALDPAFAAQARLTDHFARLDFDPAARQSRGGYRATLCRVLQGQNLAADGRSALRALTGLDLRDPLADSRLLEFCAAIPGDQFLRNGQTRWLARRVLADRLPPMIIENRRRGAQCPEWFDRLDARRDRIARDIAGLENSPTASRVLDIARLKALTTDWPSDPAQAMRQGDAYRFVLARGAHVGEFIRWVEGANG